VYSSNLINFYTFKCILDSAICLITTENRRENFSFKVVRSQDFQKICAYKLMWVKETGDVQYKSGIKFHD